jgi:cellulose synthase/poly-beta-1,6-N-acetylglucosamine synthase-like glycosyltransferase
MIGTTDEDPRHLPFLVVFLIAIAISWFFSLSRWANLIHALTSTRLFTDNPSDKAGEIHPGQEPHVTIQICTYNEGTVVKETIARACSVDWPNHKLSVQVLDDSTDGTSCDVVRDSIAFWRSHGIDVAHMRRPDRVGYKAGSLCYHFGSIKGDFVAHFVRLSIENQ